MQIENNLLIDDLLKYTDKAIAIAHEFKKLPLERLNFKSDEKVWSILQCIEHLNLYGAFYLPEMEKRILENKNQFGKMVFKSGILGNYFAELMLVKNGKVKKMQSPKDKIPSSSALSITTLDMFLKQQDLLKSLLNQARTMDLTKIKSSISLSPYIKLRIGDTFRFYVYHMDRHIWQAKRIVIT